MDVLLAISQTQFSCGLVRTPKLAKTGLCACLDVSGSGVKKKITKPLTWPCAENKVSPTTIGEGSRLGHWFLWTSEKEAQGLVGFLSFWVGEIGDFGMPM